MSERPNPEPVRDARELLPLRLHGAAQAIADHERAALGFPAADLDTVSDPSFDRFVALARAALDGAAAAEPTAERPLGITHAAVERIFLAKVAAQRLRSQGIVLLDITADGDVRVSTWARDAGTPADALGVWARSFRDRGLTAVPFRTVFGMGCDGVPTPLTTEERASLDEAGRAYADRNTMETDR